MSRWRDLGIFALLLVIAAVVGSGHLGAPDLDRTATALALAGPAAAAALGLAVGRPSLAPGALAGLGAYASAALAVRGYWVPVALLAAVVVTAVSGGIIALLTARVNVVGLLAATLLVTIGLGAMVQALPTLSGGQAGLGPVPPLGTPVLHGDVVHLTATGDFHALLLVTLLVAIVGTALLAGRRGALWRAVGSDRPRAASSGLRPLRAEVIALTAGGALAGLGGAFAAHINGVATPDGFSPDVVALPLLAALLAGRGSTLGAVAAAVGTGLLGGVVLPDLGWHGPPSASALALGLLAVAVVASLLPGGAGAARRRPTQVVADDPWPLSAGEFAGADLLVEDLDVRAGSLLLVRGFSLRAAAASVHGLVGPNGAGKSTALAAVSSAGPPRVRLEGHGDGGIVLQPQTGGGFPACTVDETLVLAARGGGRGWAASEELAARWLQRLGMGNSGGIVCAELASGQRRLVELARVLLRRPSVLLCDEPLAGLDPAARAAAESLLRAAAAAGLTIVLAEHDRAAVARLATATTELSRGDLRPVAPEPTT